MFTFELTPDQVFAERTRQFLGLGVPKDALRRVQGKVRDMWTPGPGGWCSEWTAEAKAFERDGAFLAAARCYGVARFPIVCTEERRAALHDQTRAFLAAARQFGCAFQRVMARFDAPGGGSVQAPIHLYEPRGERAKSLVVLSGGLDTGKTELHRLALALVRLGGFAVAALDMPGTGESGLPLYIGAEAAYVKVIEMLGQGRRVGLWGISFGGHFAAKLALQGRVACAVDLGGPVGTQKDAQAVLTLPYGMTGTLCNALGLAAIPDLPTMSGMLQDFTLEPLGLSEPRIPVPLLVLNGASDQYIARSESVVFAGKKNAQVWLVPGATHCAAEVFVRIVPSVVTWLGVQLGANRLRVALVGAVAKAIAPRFERVSAPDSPPVGAATRALA